MSLRLFAPAFALAAAVIVAGCTGSNKPPVRNVDISDTQCVALADSIKTLRYGDPLPRVVQVIGEPARSYRVTAPFGSKYDVLEYDVGNTPCARLMLNSPKKMAVLFDEHGGYVGAGRNKFLILQRATAVRLSGVPLDTQAIGY